MPGSATRSALDAVLRSSRRPTDAGLSLTLLVAVADVFGVAFDLVCANAGSVSATRTMTMNERTRFMDTSNSWTLLRARCRERLHLLCAQMPFAFRGTW